jgi:hypothetical protein
MSTQVQYRRGSGSQNDAFTGALGEITVDTTAKTIRVHDGATAGGSNIATVSYVTAQIGALSANSITDGTSSVAVIASGGNIRSNVAGSTVQTISAGGVAIIGNLSVTGNATLSGNILADRIENGSTNIEVLVPGGNANISVGGVSNVAVFTTTGLTVASNIAGGNLLLSGAIEDSAQLDIRTTASNANIVLTPNGTGNVNISSNLMPTSNAVANIGSSTAQFNTIFARATSAQYADLAEMYVADANYPPGTVVEFGGTQEITISSASHSTAVAGIVSTNPSYLMNSTQTGEHVLPVALTGRVPCQVQGPVRKGDVLVASSTPGVAQRIGMNWQPGCVVGKSMAVIDTAEIKTIEVAVGRL